MQSSYRSMRMNEWKWNKFVESSGVGGGKVDNALAETFLRN